jgi:CRP/FNR family cyclic AMP-dependent transcriptional regulator
MQTVYVAGYIASALVFIALYMKDMLPLRVLAICSNVAVLVYGGIMHLAPVMVLSALVLPLNVWRLLAAMDRRRRRMSAGVIEQ